MNRIYTDVPLREALHGLYLGLFAAHKKAPNDFQFGRVTTILTAIMGVENLGWRVVGITPKALKVFAQNEFRLLALTPN